ncbi:hypothetical protein OSC27_06740 [Microbacterium sp. STN6]|uniref:hypothetical protein n=1 Tax=Microbacterium sp. STN6 TaxID=2995588 RepID=UPI0022609C60|nr:hypothetical protein [Microbacterium sp. STN6]MCX7521975.1 hypothetical protein [Microbacterium sp. STN6]
MTMEQDGVPKRVCGNFESQEVVRDTPSARCIPFSPCDTRNFTVNASDLVNFTPAAPSASMEPDGWAIVGLPANFLARATGSIQSGMLLGYQAQVRFTPHAYVWSYGDGATRRTSAAGATWAALRVPEFSQTATSHIYTAKGVHQVRLTVEYTAEYRYGEPGWRPVNGVIPADATVVAVLASDAKTVLVDKDCNANPTGPGC